MLCIYGKDFGGKIQNSRKHTDWGDVMCFGVQLYFERIFYLLDADMLWIFAKIYLKGMISMKKCDFCTQSGPNGKCGWSSQFTRKRYCEEAVK